MSHGTFRNKVSELIKRGKVEWVCDSPQGFYILKGSEENPNTITDNDHTVVNRSGVVSIKDKIMNQSQGLIDKIIMDNESSRFENPRVITNNPLYRYVKSIPFGQLSIHDIRLRFDASGIWNKVSTGLSNEVLDGLDKEYNLRGFKIEKRSEDISFLPIIIDNLQIHVKIHRTDRVSVIIGCSYTPVLLDLEGIQRLSNVLSVIQSSLMKLVSVIDNNIVNIVARKKWNRLGVDGKNKLRALDRITSTKNEMMTTTAICIPQFMYWIVTMWHFGADTVHEYSGEKFNCSWELAQNIIINIYSKDRNRSENIKSEGNGHKYLVKRRIRVERQEYPKVPLHEALKNKCHNVMEAIEK